MAGFYAGAEFGLLWQGARWTTNAIGVPAGPIFAETATASLGSGAPRPGLFAGYTIRSGTWLAGWEADIGAGRANRQLIGIPGSLGAADIRGATDGPSLARVWDASLRARLGLAVGAGTVVYATGGLALAATQLRLSCKPEPTGTPPGGCLNVEREESKASYRLGWTLGAGAEMSLADRWFARAEYRYSAYGSLRHMFFAADPANTFAVTTSLSDHRASLGLGYRY